MTVIGIDTAGRVGGAGAVRDGRLLAATVLGVEESHSQNLLPSLTKMMSTLQMDPAEIEGIAVAVGPGSFTGLRIGIAAAKGLAYAWSVPVRGVSTLAASAWTYRGVDGVVCASLDARRQSVFCGFYDGLLFSDDEEPTSALVEPEARLSVGSVADRILLHSGRGRKVYLVGDGSAAVAAAVGAAGGRVGGESDRSRSGKGDVVRVPLDGEGQRTFNVAHIGEVEIHQGRCDEVFGLVPNYLRLSEAERRWKQKQS